ncbi:MAG: alkaline phosphatase [Bacteroidetes bacterium]|nr:alkaline phosphatase [Bacteroidota bacterium]
MNKLLLITGCLVSINGFTQTESALKAVSIGSGDEIHARNIILMIGDGMGVAQIYAGLTANKGHLNIERFQNIGFSKTYSASDYITDSGAGATAIATGKKSYNGAISIDSEGYPCRTILEYAEDNGKATGLVATSSITHATPACFIAHQKSRNNFEEIAEDFLKTDIDVFIGGGLKDFKKRKDQKDLTVQLAEMGYALILSPDSIKNAGGARVAGLVYMDSPPKYSEGRNDMLANATKKALEILSRDNDGFFLMIEGSQIDWGGHDNDTRYIVDELLDFDRTIGLVLDFAKNDGNTLVIVTADHETGGMGLTGGDFKTGEIKAGFISTDHTGVMVPVFAIGPQSEIFRGIYENTEIFGKMMMAFGFKANIRK